MDTCTNCGASLRPGAKFCTTCGTRLNDMPPTSIDGWGTPRTATTDAGQETSVMESVQGEDTQPQSQSWQTAADSWSGSYGSSSTSTDDPASRFISALDGEVEPVKNQPAPTDAESEAGAPVFTPPPPSNWSYSPEFSGWTDTESDSDESKEVTWETPPTWPGSDVPGNSAVDAAGFTDDGDDEVDYLSGDENIEVSNTAPATLSPEDARDKAIALADELRRTIRMMASGGESDHGAAVMALTEASLSVGDFSDVRGVLAEVRNDPRDIETLTNLAGRIDRIEALLDEHKSLADAIETAIKELNG